jgi:hypothetical protein
MPFSVTLIVVPFESGKRSMRPRFNKTSIVLAPSIPDRVYRVPDSSDIAPYSLGDCKDFGDVRTVLQEFLNDVELTSDFSTPWNGICLAVLDMW